MRLRPRQPAPPERSVDLAAAEGGTSCGMPSFGRIAPFSGGLRSVRERVWEEEVRRDMSFTE
ncbi:hypothetical protein AAJCM20276_32710 [Acetobacter aceti]|uniref:Uncharacterized protein n=1 Tax=Acetobacter aceti TaxID=435 RepID=A0A6S6PHT1_ACEAC|nr:hypothetical protein AAJCM20276_32710 [Acetobacter aceti]